MAKPKLLIVDDDEGIRTQLKYALRDDYALWLAEDRAQAMSMFTEAEPAVVSLDLGLPPSPDAADEGLKALDEMLRQAPATKIIVVTGNSDRENALRAVQLGAFDYHLKPIDLDEFKVVLRRAAHLHGLHHESDAWIRDQEGALRFEEILGNTPTMKEIFTVVHRVARTDATVLIEGESGTGKELIARAIHRRSGRSDGPFVAINCGAIPETLLESELFGHERGAFTGAHVQRKGKLEAAEGGTLFLDEIGELPLLLQVKILRFLQERTIERIGGRQPIQLDLRVMAATNRDLKRELQRGLFREDLYYRLSVVTIQLPPLRERGEDVILLANHFLHQAAQEQRRRSRLSPEALRALIAHQWPGNIRELENKVRRAVIMAHSRVIEPPDLDLDPAAPAQPTSLRETRERVEREALIETLSRHRGNVSQAARELQVSRPTLHGLLDKYGINARDFR
ncbi:MAG: PEP-CTERM-box response regulator transcription factor [Candidatus Rokubacteria bacterium]|nr:PEP-CTERM-box response regulator transcription factor [Candidatus Rokubacteria bacterium]